MIAPATLQNRIRQQARAAGFDAVGFSSALLPSSLRDQLLEFLSLGRHGDMGWLETRAEQRAQPQTLWADAKSVIMLGMNYGPEANPLPALDVKTNGVISVYAQNRDYHDLVKKRLKRVARQIVEDTGAEVKVFVDTAPVMEKPLAARAGLGWQGKHTNLVSREFGSWLFLGAIFTTLNLAESEPAQDSCGSCNACLDICPTDAFPAPYQLDARKCISYLTIEHQGPIPRDLRRAMGNRIYGCDDCLAACPWNKFASQARESALHAREDLKTPSLKTLVQLDDAEFRALFSGSPVKRTGHNRFIRNVLIAIGNSGDNSLLESVLPKLDDDNALVRGAAIWAASQLAPAKIKALRQHYEANETNQTVQAEWRST
ncbi:tRNA epoxyqueuosine(34) reductase QueG [Hyphococcus sp.]|uniref:tRNA epoxyqueuosine(34) reductase QueG n=1 Tax=Hyphococcus sp. TaxID=2038636 RepID=UPI0020831783|nr:MAG: epoxyqueuosine reductase [Marinicaulis sp.]